MTNALAEARDMVKIGTEAMDRATAEVLVARNTKVVVKANTLAEARVGVMDSALAKARDMVKVGTEAKDRATEEVRVVVKVGTEAKDRATAEVLVATNARVAVKVSSDNYYYLPATVKSSGY